MALVKVKGLPSGLTTSDIDGFYSDKTKSGGGVIQHSSYDDKKKCWDILFEDVADADAVLKKSPQWPGHGSKVVYTKGGADDEEKKSDQEDDKTTKPEDGEVEDAEKLLPKKRKKQSHFKVGENTIMVRNLTDDTTKVDVQEYFEGFGEIENMEYMDSEDGYQITFKESKTAARVLKTKNHVIDEEKIKVTDMTEFTVPEMLKVKPLKGQSESQLLQYFKNARKSNGGKIAYLQYKQDENSYLILYEDSRVIERVLDKTHENYKIAVERMERSLWQNIKKTRNFEDSSKEAGAILINNLHPEVDEFMLCRYFENHHRSGGGPISRIWMLQDHKAALIEFGDVQVTNNILKQHKKRKHQLFGNNLSIEKNSDPESTVPPDLEPCRYIKETVVPLSLGVKWPIDGASKVTRDAIELLFESTQRSGGGAIKAFIFAPDVARAVITFYEEETAYRTYQQSPLQLEGVKLTCVLLEGEVLQDSCAVSINPVPEGIDDDMLEAHFSHKNNGGGRISSLHRNPGSNTVCITFESISVARTAAKKAQKIGKHELHVKMLEPAHPMGIVNDANPYEPRKFTLYGLPLVHEKKDLVKYLQEPIPNKVLSVFYGCKAGRCIVEFTCDLSHDDYQMLRFHIATVPFMGKMCQISRTIQMNAVQLAWNPGSNISMQHIQTWFGHSNYGTTDITETRMQEGNYCAVMTFSDDRVFTRGILVDSHHIGGFSCSMKRYYQELGLQPPHYDHSNPPVVVPDSTTVQAELSKVEFILASDIVQDTFNSQIKKLYGNIDWPPMPYDQVLVKCVLDKNNPAAAMIGATWKNEIERHWQHMMEQISVTEVEVVDEILSNFKKEANNLVAPYDKTCMLLEKRTTVGLVVCGTKVCQNQLLENIKSMKTTLETELEKAKTIVKKKVKLHKDHQETLLKKTKFKEQMLKKIPGMQKIEFSENVVLLEGQFRHVTDAEDMLLKALAAMATDTILIPPAVAAALTLDKNIELVEKNAKDAYFVLEKDQDKPKVTAYGMKDELVKQLLSFIKSNFSETKVAFKAEFKGVLMSTDWTNFIQDELHPEVNVFLIEEDTSQVVVIIGSRTEHAKPIKDKILKFHGANDIGSKSLDIDVFESILMKRHLQNKIDAICDSFLSMNIGFDTGNDKHIIMIEGRRVDIDSATSQVKQLIQSIQSRDHKVTKFGMYEYFANHRGQDFIRNLESKHPAKLHVGKQAMVDDNNVAFVVGGVSILVSLDDITNCVADVIVNPGNVGDHGRLTRQLFKKAGRAVEKEYGSKFPKGRKKVPWAVESTGAGYLKGVKQLTHVIIPWWERNGDKWQQMSRLQKVLVEVLNDASRNAYKSIALPPVGIGQGFPPDVAIQALAAATVEFCQKGDVSIEEIGIIVRVHGMLFDIRSVITTAMEKSYAVVEEKPYPRPMSSRIRRDEVEPPRPMPGVTVTNQRTLVAKGVSINILSDSIATQQGDVIVSVMGAVFRSVEKQAGPDLKKELKRNNPPSVGNVVVTSAYNLKCKYVFHGNCPSWSRNHESCKQLLRKLVQTILEKAEERKCRTIFIPALGTGRNGIPPDVSAKLTFDAAIAFAQNAKHVTKVNLVIYHTDNDVLQGFERTAKTYASSAGGSAAPAASSKLCDSHMVKQMKIDLRLGDITDSRADVIVCSTGAQFSIKHGLARVIADKAGDLFVAECNKKSIKEDLKKNFFVTVPGHGLGAKNVMFITAMGSQTAWAMCINKCLAQIRTNGWQTATFPALGTGGGNISPDKMADVIFETLADFAEKNTDYTSKVTIAIPHDRQGLMEIFLTQMGHMKTQPASSSRGKQPPKEVKKGLIKGTSQPTIKGPTLPAGVVRIYATEAKVIDEVETDLLQLYRDEYREVKFDSSADRDAIARLDKKQVSRIQKLQKDDQVKVEVSTSKTSTFIEVKGQKDEVTNVAMEINNIFREVDRRDRDAAEAIAAANKVQWYFETEDGEFEKFNDRTNGQLEKAFNEKLPDFEWTERSGDKYKVVFKKMEMTTTKTKDKVKVKRNELANTELPVIWGMDSDETNIVLGPVKQGTKEFQDVEDKVNKTAASPPTIHKIERVQNPTLYKQYIASKTIMEKEASSGVTVERHLWHGTAATAIPNINKSGFDSRYHGKNGTSYGMGSYFARDFSYSFSYAGTDSSGHRKMYLCRVLTGEFTNGNSSMVVAPPKSATKSYDSVVDNTSDPAIFVIFRDTHAYPEYLLSFS